MRNYLALAVVLSACSGGAATADEPVPFAMTCSRDLSPRLTGVWTKRCENEEVVCYVTMFNSDGGSTECHWKQP